MADKWIISKKIGLQEVITLLFCLMSSNSCIEQSLTSTNNSGQQICASLFWYVYGTDIVFLSQKHWFPMMLLFDIHTLIHFLSWVYYCLLPKNSSGPRPRTKRKVWNTNLWSHNWDHNFWSLNRLCSDTLFYNLHASAREQGCHCNKNNYRILAVSVMVLGQYQPNHDRTKESSLFGDGLLSVERPK